MPRFRKTPYLFLLPNLAFIITGLVLLIIAVRLSFFFIHFVRQDLGEIFVGFQNYYEIVIEDPTFWTVVRNMAFFTIGAFIGEFLLGLGLAVTFYKQVKYRGVLISLIMIPMLLAPVMVGLTWQFLGEPSIGFLNVLLRRLNLTGLKWFSDATTVIPMIIVTDIWQWTPFVMLAFLAGIESIPPSLLESAAIDGASSWNKFRYVILPGIKYLVVVILLLRLMDILKEFDKVYTTTQGGPGLASELIAFHIWRETFQNWYIGYGAALSIYLLIVTMIIANIFVYYLKRGR